MGRALVLDGPPWIDWAVRIRGGQTRFKFFQSLDRRCKPLRQTEDFGILLGNMIFQLPDHLLEVTEFWIMSHFGIGWRVKLPGEGIAVTPEIRDQCE